MITGTACLDVRFRVLAERLLSAAQRYGPYEFTSTCRDRAEQAALWATRDTNAFPVLPPGFSMHERGLAVDMSRPDVDPYRDLFLHMIGSDWRAAAPGKLVWDASDPIHFEYRP